MSRQRFGEHRTADELTCVMGHNETDIANVAAAIGDVSRTKVLLALAEGGALQPSALAAEAGVSNSTISGHLAKLIDAKLLTVERDGRHRYYRLATPDVARALEELARIARPLPIRSLRQGSRTQALLQARLCYDHLAGKLGVALMSSLVQRQVLAVQQPNESLPKPDDRRHPDHGVSYYVTPLGHRELTAFGVPTDDLPERRPAVRYCIDWAEQRPHLAGSVGAALTNRLFALQWINHGKARRVVRLTDSGRTGLHDTLGVPLDWDSKPA